MGRSRGSQTHAVWSRSESNSGNTDSTGGFVLVNGAHMHCFQPRYSIILVNLESVYILASSTQAQICHPNVIRSLTKFVGIP